MRSSRIVSLVAASLAAVTVAACGSSAAKSASTSPPTKLALSRASDEAKAALYPLRPTRYVLDGSLDDLGADAPVYRLVGHEVTEADVARIAAVFGMQAAPVRTEWGWEVRDGDALLNVETSGGATWLDYSSAGNAGAGSVGGSTGSGSSEPSKGAADSPPVAVPGVPPDAPDAPDAPDTPDGRDTPVASPEPLPEPLPTTPPPVDVPNADDAVRIAQRVLDDLGVLDGQQWAHDVTDTSIDRAVSCASDTACDYVAAPAVSARNVNYALVVDGVRIPDVGWNVTVGSHGAVDALSGTWARPEPAGTYPLRSPADVFADLQHDRAQHVGAQTLAAGAAEVARDDVATDPTSTEPIDVRVTGVSAGRARWDGSDGNRPAVYLVPTYRFHAQADEGEPYDIELLALDPSAFTIATPAPIPEPAAG